MDTVNSSDCTSENETVVIDNRNVSFMDWLDREYQTVLKITERNSESIEKKFDAVITKIAESSVKQIDVPKFEHSDRLNELTNQIIKVQGITAQIEDYENRLLNMENEITLLKTKYTADYNARKCKMVAHRRAIRCYETLFGIKMTLGASNNGETTMHMIFKGFKQYCVTLVVDDNYHIISLDVISCKDSEEYKALESLFKDGQLQPLPFLIKLRKYITNLN